MKENNHGDNVCKSFMSSNEYLPFHSIFPLYEYAFRVLPLSCQFIFFCFVFVLFITYEITLSIYMEIIAKQGVATVTSGFPFSS